MTVLDQGSLKVFLARVVPLTTLPPSLLMILAFPQQFSPGRVCADLGFLPQGMVFL